MMCQSVEDTALGLGQRRSYKERTSERGCLGLLQHSPRTGKFRRGVVVTSDKKSFAEKAKNVAILKR